MLLHFIFYSNLFGTILCHTYQTPSLFLSFSDLAALEANSLKQTNPHPPSAGHRLKKNFVLKCHEDSIEVVLKAHVFHPELPVEPDHLRLGSAAVKPHCEAKVSESGDYIIRAPLTDCGGHVTFTPSAVLYNNLLLFSPPPSPGDMLEAHGAAVPVQCEYRRRYTVSSKALKPTWSPLITTQYELMDLDFKLRLMTDNWSSERKSSVYFLGETVNMEASVDHHHLPLRVYINSCVATLSSDVNSYPRYSFIDHQGCFTDSQLHGSSSRFLPRVQEQILHVQLQSFLFHQDHRHTIYITCNLEAEPISSKEPKKKACSFTHGRWRSVDGNDGVCESCSSSAKSNHKRAVGSRVQHGHSEQRKETRLGPVMFLITPEKHTFSLLK